MSTVGHRETRTPRRVVDFITDALNYVYPGNGKNRVSSSHVETALPTSWLKRQGTARQGDSTWREPESQTET